MPKQGFRHFWPIAIHLLTWIVIKEIDSQLTEIQVDSNMHVCKYTIEPSSLETHILFMTDHFYITDLHAVCDRITVKCNIFVRLHLLVLIK